MGASLNIDSVNHIKAGSVIYKQGEKVDTFCVILEGRVIVYNQGIKMIMGIGSFIGISDVYQKTYMSNYVAYENITVYTFQINDKKDIKKVMSSNKDYSGLMVSNLNKYIKELGDIASSLRIMVDELYEFIHNVNHEYVQICNANKTITSTLRMNNDIKNYENQNNIDSYDVKYYEECLKLPEDIQKVYFSYSSNLTLLHVTKQAELINQLIEENINMTTYGKILFNIIFNEKEDCIFKILSKAALELKSNGDIYNSIKGLIEKIIVQINKIAKLYSEKSGCKLHFDKKEMEDIYFSILTVTNENAKSMEIEQNDSNNLAESAMNELKDSLNQILAYSEIGEDRKEEIKQLIIEFKELKDKTSITETSRILRKNITEAFYELYFKIYLKVSKDVEICRVIELFLDFGFIDETLLTRNQCVTLYYLKNDNNNNQGKCRVYTIKQWLDEIYAGRKEPSKNEFDLEYNEYIRENKKYNKISAEEEKDYLTNPLRKVEYEINNMFKYNNRTVSGQISIFVPILYENLLDRPIDKLFNTTKDINSQIERLVSIDYSAFYRETLYYDEAKGIQKEYIVKQAFPDIILMPTVGYNAIMWQEIEGRKRDTSGRYMLPIFGESDLFEMLVKATGRFRFELCRTIEGISWNNVREKSLTSEYSDYIQTYTRNRDLSEEQKQKIKHQIQKGRNNLREIFVLDYITWIQNESQGYLRLNKIARVIFATYCPFSKENRERNMKQSLFEEAMIRYIRDRQKKYKECSQCIRKLEKENIDIPAELDETLKFYSEL